MSDSMSHPVQTLWQRIVGWLIKSHPTKPAQARQAKLAAVILLAGEALTLVALVTGFILRANSSDPTLLGDYLLRGGILAVLLLVLFVINRRGLTTLAGIGLSVFLLILAFSLLITSGPLTPNAVALVVPVIVAGLFGPPISAIVIALLAGLAYLSLNLYARPDYLTSFFKDGEVLQTILVYFNLAIVALMSWLFSRMARQALEESQELSLALVAQRNELEARIVVQTRQFQATTTVVRAIAGTRDLDQLLQNIVRLVRETFGYHHVQVFLVDEATEYAILRQSTGEAGLTLLQQGHRLPVGSMSVIGQVTASRRPVIASDTDADFVHRRDELLPGTRSEIALPLAIGERVIGALDMQSLEPNTFDETMLPTFQALADQLAVAIENARLFEQAQANLREFRELSRDVTQRSWADFLAESREEERHQIHGPEPKGLQVHRSRVIERVLGSGSIVVSTGKDGRQAFIAAPIVVRNEVIGVLGIEPDDVREWTQEDLHLLQRIAERTALAVENARLYLQTQRAAERERLISDIATQLQRAPNLALLLESAAQELSQALGTDNVYAEISLEHPLAHSRKQVSATEEEGDTEETGATTVEDMPAPDEPEEARAEL
jgi:GAF domain-containing protein